MATRKVRAIDELGRMTPQDGKHASRTRIVHRLSVSVDELQELIRVVAVALDPMA
jgi:hypothetical protein